MRAIPLLTLALAAWLCTCAVTVSLLMPLVMPPLSRSTGEQQVRAWQPFAQPVPTMGATIYCLSTRAAQTYSPMLRHS